MKPRASFPTCLARAAVIYTTSVNRLAIRVSYTAVARSASTTNGNPCLVRIHAVTRYSSSSAANALFRGEQNCPNFRLEARFGETCVKHEGKDRLFPSERSTMTISRGVCRICSRSEIYLSSLESMIQFRIAPEFSPSFFPPLFLLSKRLVHNARRKE